MRTSNLTLSKDAARDDSADRTSEGRVSPKCVMKEKPSLVELVEEVMRDHRDHQSPYYNECEKSPCQWCANAQAAIDLAAASELLEVLKVEYCTDCSGGDHCNCPRCCALRSTRAAIAKAKGQS